MSEQIFALRRLTLTRALTYFALEVSNSRRNHYELRMKMRIIYLFALVAVHSTNGQRSHTEMFVFKCFFLQFSTLICPLAAVYNRNRKRRRSICSIRLRRTVSSTRVRG